MKIAIFTGPTLLATDARKFLDATYLPPAAQGDIYRVALQRPKAIGLIDGYFDSVPSVWHKEILWAMNAGIHVFGSASMGALRAVELSAFGMQGVGAIYAAYQRGELDDDDEVAVVHAAATSEYRAMSVALVNIRATLAAAEAQGIIGPATHTSLVQIAKQIFYPERSYARLLEQAATHPIHTADLAALQAWLPGGQVDQKRNDAIAMLHAIMAQIRQPAEPKQVSYYFEHTIYWDYVCQTIQPEHSDALETNLLISQVFDEARLERPTYELAQRGAYVRLLAHTLAEQQGQQIADGAVEEAILAFRRRNELHTPIAMQEWLTAQRLSAERFASLMKEQALARTISGWAAYNITRGITDQLRIDGSYARLVERARHKQQLLREHGRANVGLAESRVSRQQLLEWYFVQQCRQAIPAEPGQYAREAGFASEQAFLQAILREFHYQGLTQISVTIAE